MDQSITARKDADEGTELGDVHHPPFVDSAHLGGGRIHNQHDLALGLGDLVAVRRGDGHDAHHAIVVDTDVGSGLGLNGVDHLALRTDDLTDLLHRDLERLDLRRVLADVVARSGNRLGHDSEDRQSGFLGLVQGVGQDVGGNAVDLGVQLECGDELRRTGHLEVHVAEGVLRTEDVGEGDVLAVLVDEAHGDAGHRGLDRHTGVHHRKAGGAHRTHGARAVGRKDLRHQAQGVGELLEARDDREQGPLCERTVADLTTLRTPHEACLTGREGREVVVVHEPLAVDRVDAVDHLVHTTGTQGGEVQHLGLAPLEEARTVRRGDDRHLRRHRPEVARATPVDADALGDDAGSHGLLGDRTDGTGDVAIGIVHLGELRKQLVEELGLECRLGGTTLGLVGNGLGLGDALGTGSLDRSEHLGGVVARDLVGHDLRRSHGGHELLLELDDLADELLGELQAVSQNSLVDLRGTGLVDVAGGLGATSLDHHHRDVAVVQQAAGHDHLEGRLAALLVGGMRNPLAGRGPGDAHRTDRAVERDAGQHQGRRGAVQGQHVVGVLHVGTNDGAHDVDLVSKAVREHWP